MKLTVLLVLTVVIKVCCQSDSGSCCRDFDRLNESVTNMLIRVNDLENQNIKLKIQSRRMKKEIQELQSITMKPRCPQGFKRRRHSCYLLVKTEHTKRNAARFCRRKSCSRLVRIQTDRELHRLTDYLDKEKDVPSILFTRGHLDGSLTAGSGSAYWVWSKSKRIKLFLWNKLGDLPLEDMKRQTATCAVLAKTGNSWALKSEYCKEKRAFICEKGTKANYFYC